MFFKTTTSGQLLITGLVWALLLASFLLPKCRDRGIPFSQVRSDLEMIAQALERYKELDGEYPSQQQGLMALVIRPETPPIPQDWVQLFDSEEGLFDLWGKPYRYLYPGTKEPSRPEIISAGPDMVFETEDDISSQAEKTSSSDR